MPSFQMAPDAHHICQKFNRKYYNKKSQTSRSAEDETPFFMLEEEAPVVSRDLFRDSIRDSINKEATLRRNTSNMDSKQHAGLFQTILKEHWDALSDDEKEQWHKAAMEMNEKSAGEHQDLVYRCVASRFLCYCFNLCVVTRSVSLTRCASCFTR